MNILCERIEALLPSLVEGTLVADDAAVVASHIESCAACRESLSAFVALEKSLVLRRDDVPSVEGFLPELAPSHQAARAHSRVVKIFRVVMSAPGISILLVMWSTMLAFAFRSNVADDVTRWSSLERWQVLTGGATQFLMSVTGDRVWVLAAVYGGLTILILGSMGAMTLKFIRR